MSVRYSKIIVYVMAIVASASNYCQHPKPCPTLNDSGIHGEAGGNHAVD